MLPKIKMASKSYNSASRKMFIAAEGFEQRSLYWISNEENKTVFERSIICKYDPGKKSRFQEMYSWVKKHTNNEPLVLNYDRFEPTVFEQNFKNAIAELEDIDEIIIDISVMSKLMIMIVLCCLKKYDGKLTILYSEPCEWGPAEEKFKDTMENRTHGTCIGLSSIGVGNVVRTPYLSSIVMQDCPILLIAFLSFNEQLINVLINEINPTQICIINHKCSRAAWRENAMYLIHENLIDEYRNSKNKENIDSFEWLDYIAVFEKLVEIYKNNCYNYRIVISPTGCKLQAVACALLKNCCSDIHVEYPTPESYWFEEFTSDTILKVHEIAFDNYKREINDLPERYHLNG